MCAAPPPTELAVLWKMACGIPQKSFLWLLLSYHCGVW
jgi:hypothetical protein